MKAEETLGVLRNRSASRAIREEIIQKRVLENLAEAARLTPSCYNNQPWCFQFITSKEGLERAQSALSNGNLAWARRAPLLIVGYSRPGDDCPVADVLGQHYNQFDLGMAVMSIMMVATEIGLTARPMAGFNPDRLRENFTYPEEVQIMIMIAVGWIDDDLSYLSEGHRKTSLAKRERKKISEIVVEL